MKQYNSGRKTHHKELGDISKIKANKSCPLKTLETSNKSIAGLLETGFVGKCFSTRLSGNQKH